MIQRGKNNWSPIPACSLSMYHHHTCNAKGQDKMIKVIAIMTLEMPQFS